ncbi:hypothetical protein [Thermodesulfovibrio yellowstonii]|uniref:hypothetical protein n=1 Tax=Thermodesulfovibrio yellowstonii TaxID=28262 RepID=UPI0004253731|nr:hypothetical protein [Thermodesulfovibrio islandicus]
MRYNPNLLEGEKHCHILTSTKRLVAAVVLSYYKDLKNLVLYPLRAKKQCRLTGQNVRWILDFWKQDALDFLQFLYGAALAEKAYEKVLPLLNKAEEVFYDYGFDREVAEDYVYFCMRNDDGDE